MKKSLVVAAVLASAPLLSGCLVADVAGAAVGLTTMAVGATVGGVVDLVTTDEDEQQTQDIERLKKENEELKRQQQASQPH
jgi:predicted small secreted protein